MPRGKHHVPQKASDSIDALSILDDGGPLPSLIVFDLDYTLWPFWIDTHVRPPIRGDAKPPKHVPSAKATPSSSSASSSSSRHQPFATSFRDGTSARYTFYPDVATVLTRLEARGIPVAAASRTETPPLAREALRLLRIVDPSEHDDDGGDGGGGDAPARPPPASALAPNPRGRSADAFFAHMELYPGTKKRHFQRLARAAGVACEDMLFFDDDGDNLDVETLGVVMCLVRDGVSVAELERGIKEWRRRRRRSSASAVANEEDDGGGRVVD